jgi:hypothetical protein
MRDISDSTYTEKEYIIDVSRNATITLSLAVFWVIKSCIRVERYEEKGFDDGNDGKAYWKDIVSIGVNNSINRYIKSEKEITFTVRAGEQYKIQWCGEFTIKQI